MTASYGVSTAQSVSQPPLVTTNQGVDGGLLANTPACQNLISLIDEIKARLAQIQHGSQQSDQLDLAQLTELERQSLERLLGRGEITLKCESAGCHYYETQIAGLWRDALHPDLLSIGAVPAAAVDFLKQSLQEYSCQQIDTTSLSIGVQQLLKSVQGRYSTRGRLGTVINLTHASLSQDEIEQLRQVMQPGNLTIQQSGACVCQMESTRFSRVWWVRFMSHDSKTMVEALEIGNLPKWLVGKPEDMDRSQQRLRDIATWLNPDIPPRHAN